ncbi:histone-lysine N-methyltransferase SETMAR [Nephila pilipes]|uniref:Histone-lysine N-methyltransferase SETMAR n=1 Tax=Nephila pilipes TaxID=299642 RepID=A0A8X6UIA6_NEPPI|nr:histone-lysine N-methyltransferase SETMAR [Nephila pilipes]
MFLKCNTPTKIKEEVKAVYGDTAPLLITVKFWTAQFKGIRISLEDDERSGRYKNATSDDNIAKVHQMVLGDIRIKVREIAETMYMSIKCVCPILNQVLGLRELSMLWVPCLLT